MGRRTDREETQRRRRPATSPEAREDELAALAYDRAEQQIRDGTASSQVLTHFLKVGSRREQLEQQQIQHNIEMTREKQKQLEGQQRMEAMYTEALAAMRGYSGLDQGPIDDDDFIDVTHGPE